MTKSLSHGVHPRSDRLAGMSGRGQCRILKRIQNLLFLRPCQDGLCKICNRPALLMVGQPFEALRKRNATWLKIIPIARDEKVVLGFREESGVCCCTERTTRVVSWEFLFESRDFFLPSGIAYCLRTEPTLGPDLDEVLQNFGQVLHFSEDCEIDDIK
ncbi:hypothetical protein AVEN_94537-1 [Araneus ventricosus]|uniref:Uncharacterized protein n=1 Tax=Araneus ventricosus TaxID=182803 RepID=A0A4Y2SJC1_ARAVE|nr:hypothetical protein AVEN_94537-1 [Araneus ventricosus]